jgi:hypothetical protein
MVLRSITRREWRALFDCLRQPGLGAEAANKGAGLPDEFEAAVRTVGFRPTFCLRASLELA